MLSYFETDLNCSACFNRVVDALTATAGVSHVEGHSSTSCISVEHSIDEATLHSLISEIGQTSEVADNGEVMMGDPHVATHSTCDCRERHRPQL